MALVPYQSLIPQSQERAHICTDNRLDVLRTSNHRSFKELDYMTAQKHFNRDVDSSIFNTFQSYTPTPPIYTSSLPTPLVPILYPPDMGSTSSRQGSNVRDARNPIHTVPRYVSMYSHQTQ